MSEDLIPSVSIDALLAARDYAQQTYTQIAEQLDKASANLARFGADIPRVFVEFGDGIRRDVRNVRDERDAEALRIEIDRLIWLRLFELTHIDTLMDHQTRNDLFKRLRQSSPYGRHDELPDLTRENIEATFSQLHADRGEYFERGVEAVYRGLSWDHKTNAPAKFGTKLIVNGAFSVWSRNYQGNSVRLDRHESLHDLERVLCILDGQPPPAHGVGLRSLGQIPWGVWIEVPATGKGPPLLSVKVHRKGTTHVQIHDELLVDDMNRIMARRHPGQIPEPPESKAARSRSGRPLHQPTPGDLQVFYTPDALADELVAAAGVDETSIVLEPSAGEGALVKAALRAGANQVVAIEVRTDAAQVLEGMLGRESVQCADFLEIPIHAGLKLPGGGWDIGRPLGRYDAVVMNPPFSGGRDAEHVMHAWGFLREGGRLAAVMSAGALFRTDRAYAGFREFAERNALQFRELPDGSFKDAGTAVRTVMVTGTKAAVLSMEAVR